MIAGTVFPGSSGETRGKWEPTSRANGLRFDTSVPTIGFIDHPSYADPALRPLDVDAACRMLDAEELGLVERADDGPVASETKLSHRLPAHLDRMCSSRVLTVHEERSLFRRMNYLKYRAAEQSRRVPSRRRRPRHDEMADTQPDDVDAILGRAEVVRNQIVQANVRLVVSIVKQFGDGRCSFDDLLSEGIHCLIKAVDKFDFDRGFRFSTYATRAIRRELMRLIRRARRDEQRWSTGRPEVLDQQSDRSEEPEAPDRLWATASRFLEQFIQQLGDREQFIVLARYGFSDLGEKPTFQRLGELLGISKERVRQLEMRAVRRLRTMSETATSHPVADH